MTTSVLVFFFPIKYYYYFVSIPFYLEEGNCLTLGAEFILSDVVMCRADVESKPLLPTLFLVSEER